MHGMNIAMEGGDETRKNEALTLTGEFRVLESVLWLPIAIDANVFEGR